MLPLIRQDSLLISRMSDMKPTCVKVYCVLISHANKNTRECWPAIGLLCEKTGLNRKTVMAATAELEVMGLISRRRGSRTQGTIYTLHLEVPSNGTSDNDAVIPKNGTNSDDSVVPENGSTRAPSRPDTDHSNIPNSSAQKSQNTDSPLNKEHTKEHTKEAPSSGSLRESLKNHGIGDPVLSELAGTSHLTSADVQRLAQRHHNGALVNQLRDLRDTRQREEAARRKRSKHEEVYANRELLEAVRAAEPSVVHIPSCDHTQAAMRKLARERGLLS